MPLNHSDRFPSAECQEQCRRIMFICVVSWTFVAMVMLVVYKVVEPKDPEFSVSSASVSFFNISASPQQLSPSSAFDLVLSVRNGNRKYAIYYDRARVAVLYYPGTLWETFLPPFYQSRGNSTILRARVPAAPGNLDESVAKGIGGERSGKWTVRFQVTVSAGVEFRGRYWSSRSGLTVRVDCPDVRIGFANATALDGALDGSPVTCQVDHD